MQSNLARYPTRLVRLAVSLVAFWLWNSTGFAQSSPTPPDGPAVSASESLENAEEASEPIDPLTLEVHVLIKRGAYPLAFKRLADAPWDEQRAQKAGSLALASGQYSNLEQFAKRWRTKQPQLELAERLEAIATLELDRRAEAKLLWAGILEHRYENLDTGFVRLRESFSTLKNQAGSVWVMRELVQSHPEVPAAQNELAMLAINAGNSPLALEALKSVLSHADVDTARRREALWLEIRALTAMGDCNGALSHVQSLIGSAAKPAEREHLLKSFVLSQCRRHEEAIAELEPLIKSASIGNDVLQLLGQEHQALSQWQAATANYQELIRRNESARGYYGLAEIAKATDRPIDALGYYFKITGPLTVSARLGAYTVLLDAHQDVLAARLMDRYLESTPEDALDLTPARVEMLVNHNQLSDARALALRTLAIFPDNWTLQLAYSNVLDHAGETDQAIRLLEKLRKQRPNDPDVANALGFTLADHHERLPEAFKLLKVAEAQRPDSGAILDSMGWWYFQMGQLNEARDYLERANARIHDPENAWHLGKVLIALGNVDDAQRVWQQGLVEAPSDQRLRRELHQEQER